VSHRVLTIVCVCVCVYVHYTGVQPGGQLARAAPGLDLTARYVPPSLSHSLTLSLSYSPRQACSSPMVSSPLALARHTTTRARESCPTLSSSTTARARGPRRAYPTATRECTCSVVYCTVLYCTVLYCTVLYCHEFVNIGNFIAYTCSFTFP
jgi:hypothetical protein